MVIAAPQRHLVEWYHADLTSATVAGTVAALEGACADLTAEGTVRLVVTMAVPTDEVLYVVFEATSMDAVVDICARAGLPPHRMTADVEARVHSEDFVYEHRVASEHRVDY